MPNSGSFNNYFSMTQQGALPAVSRTMETLLQQPLQITMTLQTTCARRSSSKMFWMFRSMGNRVRITTQMSTKKNLNSFEMEKIRLIKTITNLSMWFQIAKAVTRIIYKWAHRTDCNRTKRTVKRVKTSTTLGETCTCQECKTVALICSLICLSQSASD